MEQLSQPRSRLVVAFFASVGHVATHLLTAFYFVIVLAIEKEWGRPYAELIQLWTVGSLLMGLGALPAGWLGDRWSAGGMMVVLFLGMGACSILCGLAGTPLMLWAGLTGIGLFASIYHPVGIAWLVDSAAKQGKALGINGIFGSIGVASAGLVAGGLTELFGWRTAFIIPGALTCALGLGLLACLKLGIVADRPATRHHGPDAKGGDMLRRNRHSDRRDDLRRSDLAGDPGRFAEIFRRADRQYRRQWRLRCRCCFSHRLWNFRPDAGGGRSSRRPLFVETGLCAGLRVADPVAGHGSRSCRIAFDRDRHLDGDLQRRIFAGREHAAVALLAEEAPQPRLRGEKYVISFGIAPVALLLVSAVHQWDMARSPRSFIVLAGFATVVTISGLFCCRSAPGPLAAAGAGGIRLPSSLRLQRLIEIGDNVVDVFDPDREAHDIGAAPAAMRCSSESWRCVVEAGCRMRLRVSPILARCENSSQPSTT